MVFRRRRVGRTGRGRGSESKYEEESAELREERAKRERAISWFLPCRVNAKSGTIQ